MADRKLSPQADLTNNAVLDAAEADLIEQRRDLLDEDVEDPARDQPSSLLDADPADAAEQRMEVGFDDDEYR